MTEPRQIHKQLEERKVEKLLLIVNTQMKSTMPKECAIFAITRKEEQSSPLDANIKPRSTTPRAYVKRVIFLSILKLEKKGA